MLASTDHGPMLVNRNDFAENHTGQYGVGHQLLTMGNYDPPEVKFLNNALLYRRQLFGDGVVAIDGGANIGVFTLEWSRLMRGWGSVLAIEAQERIFYMLAGNIALQNSAARAVWSALGERAGTMEIPEPDYSQPGSFGSFELIRTARTDIGQCINYEEPTSSVQVIALDDLNLPRVDLIKLDIEGMEIEALRGAHQTIKRCRPHLFIEVAKSNRQVIESLLTEYDLREAGMNMIAVPKEAKSR